MPVILAVILIVVTTLRHEGSHALMTWIEGVELIEVRLLPGYRDDVGFYFGYIIRGDGGSIWIEAAPFIVALLWLGVAFAILRAWAPSGKAWLPAMAAGVFSPLIDLVYNYAGGLWRSETDVASLFDAFPDLWIHAYFLLAIGLCIACWRLLAKPSGSRKGHAS